MLILAREGLDLRVRSRGQGPNNLVECETSRKRVTESIEKNELQSARITLLVETERAKKFFTAPIWRHRDRQPGALEQTLQS